MKKVFKYQVFFTLFISGVNSFGQSFVPLTSDYSRVMEGWVLENNLNISTSVKPLSIHSLNEFVNSDSLFSFEVKKPEILKNWIVRKLFYENFLIADTTDFKIAIDPLFNLQYEKDAQSGITWLNNTRGIRIFGSLGNKIFFESNYFENQSTFPVYLTDYINSSIVIPGQGYTGQGIIRDFNGKSFDYSSASGMLHYRYGRHFEFSAGHGKLFIGDGYRSLFLSDNSFNYPHFRITANYGKIQYTRIMAILMGDYIQTGYIEAREKKLAGFNVLNYLPFYWLHVMFFEGNIWRYPNVNKNINFDFNYLNPVIYINSVLSNVNCKSLGGMGLKLNLLKAVQFYGQVAMDKIPSGSNSGNHFAWQAGAKYFNVFNFKNLYFQAEYNESQNGTYVYNPQILDYSHLNQALAHPLGTNFSELVLIAHYNYKRLQFNGKWNFSNYGLSSVQVPNKKTKYYSDYPFATPFIGVGPFTELKFADYKIAYLLNPKTNLKIEAGYTSRNAIVDGINFNQGFVYISFISFLENWYYDF